MKYYTSQYKGNKQQLTGMFFKFLLYLKRRRKERNDPILRIDYSLLVNCIQHSLLVLVFSKSIQVIVVANSLFSFSKTEKGTFYYVPFYQDYGKTCRLRLQRQSWRDPLLWQNFLHLLLFILDSDVHRGSALLQSRMI